GEVGEDVAVDHRLEKRPLEPGRVAEMTADHAARLVEPDRDEDIAAEAFDDRGSLAGADGHFDPNWTAGQIAERLDEPQALFDLQYPDPDARIDIAVLAHGHLEIELVIRR